MYGQVQGKMVKSSKRHAVREIKVVVSQRVLDGFESSANLKVIKARATKKRYISEKQLLIEGFENPFDQKLDANNRWIVLSKVIPWDMLASLYRKQMYNHNTGAEGINARLILGSVIIKHMLVISDREVIEQIKENMYLQYFVGYSSFTHEAPFDASLFVQIRKRLNKDVMNQINESVVLPYAAIFGDESKSERKEGKEQVATTKRDEDEEIQKPFSPDKEDNIKPEGDSGAISAIEEQKRTHIGKLLMDATTAPQAIKFPTDLDLLNQSRIKTDALIDCICATVDETERPRTYRKKAQKEYLNVAKKKRKSNKEIRKAIKQQLQYLNRNHRVIDRLLDTNKKFRFNKHQLKYYFVTKTLYDQQLEMYLKKEHKVDDRITSTHQPYVRPMVTGKAAAKTEFGSKLQVGLINGYALLDVISWDAFNECGSLIESVNKYKRRFGFYPEEVLADKIYWTNGNRSFLKGLGIKLAAKPLGRPPAVPIHLRPGDRNPIEGKFGQAKSAYGLNKIKAKLKNTSESWIASIVLILNLVKIAGSVSYCLYQAILDSWLFIRSSILHTKLRLIY